mmetsp:Transcript_23413/g.63215  ORF Transcript_23413/g.63215 Transcript_23413/m.63215 type:complete len:98 (-) Transcript_23413:315-608(-)
MSRDTSTASAMSATPTIICFGFGMSPNNRDLNDLNGFARLETVGGSSFSRQPCSRVRLQDRSWRPVRAAMKVQHIILLFDSVTGLLSAGEEQSVLWV